MKSRGSFTVSFWMDCDNWSAPFADQVLGNYITQGFGIYNESFVTPVAIIPNGQEMLIFNSDYKLIDNHTVDRTITNITRNKDVDLLNTD